MTRTLTDWETAVMDAHITARYPDDMTRYDAPHTQCELRQAAEDAAGATERAKECVSRDFSDVGSAEAKGASLRVEKQ